MPIAWLGHRPSGLRITHLIATSAEPHDVLDARDAHQPAPPRGEREGSLVEGDERWIDQGDVLAASADCAAASGQDVLDPLGPGAEGEPDEVPIGGLADPDRDSVLAPGAASAVTEHRPHGEGAMASQWPPERARGADESIENRVRQRWPGGLRCRISVAHCATARVALSTVTPRLRCMMAGAAVSDVTAVHTIGAPAEPRPETALVVMSEVPFGEMAYPDYGTRRHNVTGAGAWPDTRSGRPLPLQVGAWPPSGGMT